MNASLVFDPEALYAALDRQRRQRRIQWIEVCAEAGVPAATLTRVGQGRSVNADGLVRLMAWLGTTDIGPFTRRPPDGAG